MDEASAEPFDRMGTVGVEEEFYVVDENGRPTSGTDELVYESKLPSILTDRIDHELFKCVIETQTPTCEDLAQARTALRAVREALAGHASDHGYQIAGAGLHPAAHWRDLEHAEKPRYRSQLDRIQYPQHRNTTAGIHVHIGVDDAEKAMWIANEIRWFLPVMLALSANSPYWNGFDTGLASARGTIFESLPHTGTPTAFESFSAFVAFEELLIDHGSIADRGELWYDVRPHTEHGTVEVRAPDGQSDPAIVEAFTEYVHALVIDLAERYEDGENGTKHRREVIDENKWRAIRHGHEAGFIDRETTGEVALRDVIETESDRLGISGITEVYDRPSGTAKQRRLLDESGLDTLCDALLLDSA
jgi:glutamate---cysteine ligase / carboxylate-amine ligase